MGKRHVVVWLFFVFAVACGSPAAPPPDAGSPTNVATTAAGSAVSWVVTSVDDRGAPRFLWSTAAWVPAPSVDPVRAQLARVRGAYDGISDAALATLSPVRTVTMSSGARVTTLRHNLHGVEVYGGDVAVLLRADGSLVAIAGAPHPSALGGFFATFAQPLDGGVAAAIASMTGEQVAVRNRGVKSGRWSTFELLHPAVRASDPVRARPVFVAAGAGLRPAYLVEAVYTHGGSVNVRAARRVIAADTGAVLEAIELTANDAFNYRAWADATKRPKDDPYADFTPHPTGNPDGSQPAPTAPALTSMESFNTPPGGATDPWLAATATETQGNNVDAYTDTVAPDGFSAGDLRAATTSAKTFDHTYDLAQSALANQTQARAAIVHAFYVTNWLHDYWYDAGFDEGAGNAQLANFGRGGAQGDRMLVEVQDNANTERDNANMSTPGDGSSPRMQIYVWSPQETRTVTLTPGNITHQAGSAAYGPQTFDVTDTVVALVDNTAPTGDACNTVTNGAALNGNIALLDRGTCNFIDKTRAAQTAGAVGVILVDNVDAATPPLMGGSGGSPVTIPTLSITKAAGDALRTQMMSATVTARLRRTGGPLRDGALDSGVVAHEWGHYLHHRMVGGCANLQCGALSEGWGDFVALHMMSRPGDDLGGTYAVAGHAGASDLNSWYWGIRRTPYTSNMTKNPLTFRHIGRSQTLPPGPAYNIFATDNAEVHNAGEIWAEMMFEAYRRVQLAPNGRTHDQVRHAVASYVVAGLALTPNDATFTEQRDAILAAAAADSAADFTSMAQGFAVRGAGTCAVGPARTSTTLDGVVETFVLAPSHSIGNVTVDDSIISCDDDQILDAQETGRIAIAVSNAGPVALTDGALVVSSSTTGVSFPASTTFAVPSVPPMGSVTVLVPIALAANFPQQGTIALSVIVTSATACTTTAAKAVTIDANRDETPNTSATDTVESSAVAWTATGTAAANVWSRITLAAGQHAWQGTALAQRSDTQLVSPPLVTGAGALTMTFKHRHQFENQGNTNFDGGVIEVSQDNGQTWADASMFGTVAYTGTITATSNNPLGNRLGFVKATAGFPAFVTSTVSFGTALANRTIRVRFRIGTDDAVGTAGWTLDDIAFTGLTNTPFTSVANDAGACLPPVANAGPDQMVFVSTPGVMLDGSASSDPNNDPLTYSWQQTGGTAVALSSTTAVKPTFTAPPAPSVLTFQLTVSDGSASAMDSVTINVVATPPVDAGMPDAPPPADAPPSPDAPPPADAPPSPDAPPPADAPPSPDAAIPDAAVPDAAVPDAAVPDAAVPDAAPDAGTPDAPKPPPKGDDGGGCCSAAGVKPHQHVPLLLVLAIVILRRRRRR